MSVGSPQKLGVASEDAEPREVPMGISLAATAFRSEIAGWSRAIGALFTHHLHQPHDADIRYAYLKTGSQDDLACIACSVPRKMW